MEEPIELDHVTQVIGYHPTYLEKFLSMHTFIMQRDGPLRYDYRHYLAIMVSNYNEFIAFFSYNKFQISNKNFFFFFENIDSKLTDLKSEKL